MYQEWMEINDEEIYTLTGIEVNWIVKGLLIFEQQQQQQQQFNLYIERKTIVIPTEMNALNNRVGKSLLK